MRPFLFLPKKFLDGLPFLIIAESTIFLLNAAIVLLLYKPLSKTLRRIGFLKSSGSTSVQGTPGKGRSVLVSTIAALLIGLSLVVVFRILA